MCTGPQHPHGDDGLPHAACVWVWREDFVSQTDKLAVGVCPNLFAVAFLSLGLGMYVSVYVCVSECMSV